MPPLVSPDEDREFLPALRRPDATLDSEAA
jgi:hypothetical protein